MIWLDDQRGYLSDWITQLWVQLTGKRIDPKTHAWLETPHGQTSGIGTTFFHDLATRNNWTVQSSGKGLMQFDSINGPEFDAARVQAGVQDFYENTSKYHLDVWLEWCGVFRWLGVLVRSLFSRRLQQLNLPTSALETSRGISSEVLELIDPNTGQTMQTAWLRHLLHNGHVLYAGLYSSCQIPNSDQTCVRVAFPLPNGSAVVILKPTLKPDGSLLLTSSGRGFGDPGFYFTLRNAAGSWVRYVPTFHETIHVYEAEAGALRTDHIFSIWGQKFLHLHYRMMLKSTQ
jgi:hypothetical protein